MDAHRMHILVVDDLADAADSCAELLSLWGYDAVACHDGATALESARHSPPAAVLLDLAMPRMDGFRFAGLFRELPGCGSVALIAVTGCATSAYQASAGEVGIRHYLQKPADPARLKELLGRVVGPAAVSTPPPAATFPCPAAERPARRRTRAALYRGNPATSVAAGNPRQPGPGIAPPAGVSSPRSRGLLIVDDEPAVRRMLGTAMRQQGFDVWLASGGDAVAQYREHRSRIDVVLLDVQMPGLDGPGTLVALREIDSRVQLCFMCGDTGRYTEERLLDLGAVCVFRKPFRLAELASQLRQTPTAAAGQNEFQEARWADDGGPG